MDPFATGFSAVKIFPQLRLLLLVLADPTIGLYGTVLGMHQISGWPDIWHTGYRIQLALFKQKLETSHYWKMLMK